MIDWRVQTVQWRLKCPNDDCGMLYFVTVAFDQPLLAVTQCSNCHFVFDNTVSFEYLAFIKQYTLWQKPSDRIPERDA